MHSDASKVHIVDEVFFMFGWDQYGFDKKHDGARYAELVF
jgi:hypothetical protein